MKQRGITFLFCLFAVMSTNYAQDSAGVTLRHIIEPPAGFEASFGKHWSPNSDYIAIGYGPDRTNQSDNSTWYIYDVENGFLSLEIDEVIEWLPDSTHAVTVNEDTSTLQIVDVQTGLVLAQSNAVDLDLEYADYNLSPDGQWLAISRFDSYIKIYSTRDLSLTYSEEGYRLDLNTTHPWSPDSRNLIVVSNAYRDTTAYRLGPMHVWTLGEGFSPPMYNITDFPMWSIDSSQIAAPTDYTKIAIYDTDTGEMLDFISMDWHEGPMSIFVWQDDRLVLSQGFLYNRRLGIWDMTTRSLIFDQEKNFGRTLIRGEEMLVEDEFLGLLRVSLITGEATRYEDIRSISSASPNWQWWIEYILSDEAEPKLMMTLQRLDTLETIAIIDRYVSPVIWSPDSRFFVSFDNGPDNDGTLAIWEIVEGGFG